MNEYDYLPHLKLRLQDPRFGLLLNIKSPVFSQFAPDGWTINVLPLLSYQTYYEDPSSFLAGHTRLATTPGQTTSEFRSTAATSPFFWIAARASISPNEIVKDNAQGARDLLGLVHFGAKTELVAMHLKLAGPSVFRPTVIEANPNARFRHIDPNHPNETRWGKTIHLDILESSSPGDNIAGVPELVANRVKLSDCDAVEFHYLGSTNTDRSTTGADQKFLMHLLKSREAIDVAKSIIKQVMQ